MPAKSTTPKAPNYTDEMTAELRAAYVAEPTMETVAKFAEKFGKNARSIIAKLTREGVYQKKEYVTKTGDKPEAKDVTADAIGRILRMTEAEVTSLAKANKSALRKVFDALANSRPMVGDPETDGE